MSDISALEGRITEALDRIRKGLYKRAGQGASDATLKAALDKERASNAELVQRAGNRSMPRDFPDRQAYAHHRGSGSLVL